MRHDIEIGYIGLETSDRAAVDRFFGETIGLVPGQQTTDGASTWRNDVAAQRIFVSDGPANDARVLGIEAVDDAAFTAAVERLEAVGCELTEATDAELGARRVDAMQHTVAPWGTRVEIALGLERLDEPFDVPLFPGGFLTEAVGFGHVVFATMNFDESHHFVIDGLGMTQSDWIETELAPGLPLEVRFYHCNPRHHSLAIAKAPFEFPAALHHVMFETLQIDDVGRAFDRALASGQQIANGLGRHDNDEMFSFYVVSPAGFQVEVGHGARIIGDDWSQNRLYTDISRWGHQPIPHA